jgi:hypothetical protein
MHLVLAASENKQRSEKILALIIGAAKGAVGR